jgi:hypothetical protein
MWCTWGGIQTLTCDNIDFRPWSSPGFSFLNSKWNLRVRSFSRKSRAFSGKSRACLEKALRTLRFWRFFSLPTLHEININGGFRFLIGISIFLKLFYSGFLSKYFSQTSSPVDSKSKTKGKDMKDEIIWLYDEKNVKQEQDI